MPAPVAADRIAEYEALRAVGLSRREAAGRVGVSEGWASKHDAARGSYRRLAVAGFDVEDDSGPPVGVLEDFGLFRETYLSHVRKPWMDEAADTVQRLIATPSPEFLVINCPPGVGKSTFLEDLFTWLIVKDRRARFLYGCDTRQNAVRHTRLIQAYLEAVEPPRARPELVAIGEAVQSTRCLAADFGVFKPDSERGGIWRQDEWRVDFGDDGGSLAVKEPTMLALGRDSGVMGNRFEGCGWDDLQTEQIHRSPTQQEQLNDDWDGGMGESRLEPTDQGLLFLVMQRIGNRDLSRYNLDKRVTEFVDGREVERQMYTHICFPAHFDDLCLGVHEKGVARSYPHGCLLDAQRLPWYGPKGLKAKKENSPRAYATQYQQQDGSTDDALIHPSWVFGGLDSEGVDRPGCLNRSRSMGELPAHWLGQRLTSLITVDPSATNYWAVQWWVLNHALGARALVWLSDRKMQANQLLDWDGERFSGLLEDLWWKSQEAQAPVSHVVFEINAAQRHFTQMHSSKLWRQSRKVALLSHTTHRNKNDAELGVTILVEPYRSGSVDLPYGDVAARGAVSLLANQLSGAHERNDQLMANWFMELYFHRLEAPKKLPLMPRASWQRRRAS